MKFKTANFPAVIASRNIARKQVDYYKSMMKADNLDYEPEDKYLSYSEQSKVLTAINVYLDEDIKSPRYYRAVVDKVTSLNEGDQVYYYVASIGGRMDGLISLIEANRQTPADVICIIIGECHSAASMFALSCPNISVSPSATMMVHYVSFGTGGKASDIKANVNHTLDFTANYFREIYQGFLTEEEINSCIETGKEIWMQSDEIMDRLEKRQEYFLNKDAKEFPEIEFPESEPKKSKSKK